MTKQTTQIHLLNARTTPSNDKENKSSGDNTLKLLVTFISFVGVILTLAGFGVVLAKAEAFGLEVTDICRSPIEFLIASSDVILMMFEAVTKLSHKDEVQKELLIIGLFLGMIFVAGRAFYNALFKGGEKQRVRHLQKRQLGQKLRKLLSNNYVSYVIAAVSGPVLMIVSGWLAWLSFLVLILSIVWIPMYGFFAGKWYINKYIFEPHSCQSFRTWNDAGEKKLVQGAICVRVFLVKGDKEIARGRRIARTTEAIILYQKTTGKVMSVPIRDAVVEQVESET